MGIPVISIVDLWRMAAGKIIALAFSYVAIFAGVVSGVGYIVYKVYEFYDGIGFSGLLAKLRLEQFQLSWIPEDLRNVVYYCGALDKLVDIWDTGLYIFGSCFDVAGGVLVSGFIVVLVSISAMWMKKIAKEIAGFF